MPDTKRNILVKFIVTDAYDPEFYSFEQEMGKIDRNNLEWLMSEFSDEKNTVTTGSCVRTMSMQLMDTVNFGRNPFHNKRNRSVEVSNIFYFSDAKPKCTSVPHGADEDMKMGICCKNLADGKCCDEFIRRTLGATLFPQHYAKDKQK